MALNLLSMFGGWTIERDDLSPSLLEPAPMGVKYYSNSIIQFEGFIHPQRVLGWPSFTDTLQPAGRDGMFSSH